MFIVAEYAALIGKPRKCMAKIGFYLASHIEVFELPTENQTNVPSSEHPSVRPPARQSTIATGDTYLNYWVQVHQTLPSKNRLVKSY